MKQLGRIHWMFLVGVAGVIGIGVVLFLGGSTPTMVAGDFMVALAKGDVDRLVETTYIGHDSKEHLRQEWKFATQVAGPHYRFTWSILDFVQQGPSTASVRIDLVRNVLGKGAYASRYDLPLELEDGKWKVKATAISREIYPGLPR